MLICFWRHDFSVAGQQMGVRPSAFLCMHECVCECLKQCSELLGDLSGGVEVASLWQCDRAGLSLPVMDEHSQGEPLLLWLSFFLAFLLSSHMSSFPLRPEAYGTSPLVVFDLYVACFPVTHWYVMVAMHHIAWQEQILQENTRLKLSFCAKVLNHSRYSN